MDRADKGIRDDAIDKGKGKTRKKLGKVKWIIILAAAIVAVGLIACWFMGLIGGISESEAKEAAYNSLPDVQESEHTILIDKEFDDGSMRYLVTVTTSDAVYDLEISARSGKVISQDAYRLNATDSSSDQTSQSTQLTMEQARQIALDHVSGATTDSVKKTESDTEQGKLIYEIEIVYNGTEYDFEIDAATGNIVNWSSEAAY